MTVMGERRTEVCNRLHALLEGRDDVWLALLFGSRARGTATARSDVDVAVWAPGLDLLELGRQLSDALELEVDVVALPAADIPLLAQIIEHGMLVHEGRRGAYGSWRSHALSSLELDLPWYGRMRDAWLQRVAREGL